MTKKRILTGDRPTGKLHLGHYFGSHANRVKLQDEYECYFIIADLHMLTTKPQKEYIMEIRQNAHDLVLDYLSIGIDPLQDHHLSPVGNTRRLRDEPDLRDARFDQPPRRPSQP